MPERIEQSAGSLSQLEGKLNRVERTISWLQNRSENLGQPEGLPQFDLAAAMARGENVVELVGQIAQRREFYGSLIDRLGEKRDRLEVEAAPLRASLDLYRATVQLSKIKYFTDLGLLSPEDLGSAKTEVVRIHTLTGFGPKETKVEVREEVVKEPKARLQVEIATQYTDEQLKQLLKNPRISDDAVATLRVWLNSTPEKPTSIEETAKVIYGRAISSGDMTLKEAVRKVSKNRTNVEKIARNTGIEVHRAGNGVYAAVTPWAEEAVPEATLGKEAGEPQSVQVELGDGNSIVLNGRRIELSGKQLAVFKTLVLHSGQGLLATQLSFEALGTPDSDRARLRDVYQTLQVKLGKAGFGDILNRNLKGKRTAYGVGERVQVDPEWIKQEQKRLKQERLRVLKKLMGFPRRLTYQERIFDLLIDYVDEEVLSSQLEQIYYGEEVAAGKLTQARAHNNIALKISYLRDRLDNLTGVRSAKITTRQNRLTDKGPGFILSEKAESEVVSRPRKTVAPSRQASQEEILVEPGTEATVAEPNVELAQVVEATDPFGLSDEVKACMARILLKRRNTLSASGLRDLDEKLKNSLGYLRRMVNEEELQKRGRESWLILRQHTTDSFKKVLEGLGPDLEEAISKLDSTYGTIPGAYDWVNFNREDTKLLLYYLVEQQADGKIDKFFDLVNQSKLIDEKVVTVDPHLTVISVSESLAPYSVEVKKRELPEKYSHLGGMVDEMLDKLLVHNRETLNGLTIEQDLGLADGVIHSLWKRRYISAADTSRYHADFDLAQAIIGAIHARRLNLPDRIMKTLKKVVENKVQDAVSKLRESRENNHKGVQVGK